MKPIYIAYGSVHGHAKTVANELHTKLASDGKNVTILDNNTWGLVSDEPAICLVIVATTGAGDLPKNILPFYNHLCLKEDKYDDLSYAVLGLGDRCYRETFCNAGKRMDALLLELKSESLLPLTTIDASEIADPMEVAVPWLDKIMSHLEHKADLLNVGAIKTG